MNIKYFQDTDTLYIEFKPVEVAESKDLDENTVLDLDQSGNICGITSNTPVSMQTFRDSRMNKLQRNVHIWM